MTPKEEIDLEKFNDTILPTVVLNQPNEDILIHEGIFYLESEEEILQINGKVYSKWFPFQSVKFEGTIKSASSSIAHLKISEKIISVRINTVEFGLASITNLSLNANPKIEGFINPPKILGDKSIPVEKIRFSIANLRSFFGTTTKHVDGDKYNLRHSRLSLNNEKYIINIDQHPDFDNRNKLLQKKGGYHVLYGGEIKRKSGSILYTEVKNVLNCLRAFLTFLNGRRCSPIFCQGEYNNEIIWSDYSNYRTDQYKYVHSWPPAFSVEGLNDLWINFYDLWNNPSDKDFINSVLHWYVEANSNSGYLEGSIISAQIALELLYNWYIIEKLQIFHGKDLESITASNKIRLLLSQVNGNFDIPNSYTEISSYIKENQEVYDGVDVIVLIRNALVHSQEIKRRKLTEIKAEIKVEAQQLALWYIEYALLYILKFKGKYVNRTSNENWQGGGEENSPFIDINSV